MHRFELLRGQNLHGRVGIGDFRPGQLRDGGSVQSPAPASLTAAVGIDRSLPMHFGSAANSYSLCITGRIGV
jgi:hypothetical protein